MDVQQEAALSSPTQELPGDEILVAGRWRRGRGHPLQLLDPTAGCELMVLHTASVDDVDEAAVMGARAAADPVWRNLLPYERARYLHRIADLIERDTRRLSALQTANTGKTRAETTGLVRSSVATFRYVAATLETAEDILTPPRGPYLSMSIHEPLGLIGAITTWNSPIASAAQKVAPALAAGNAVLLKPAEWTPLAALALGRIVEEAGLPAGLLSVLPGEGSVGDAIVRHPLVAKVTFTGSIATGRIIAHHAADRLIPVSLELGGKSPTVVLPDADLEQALAGVLFGIFSSSGQACVAGSRLFVPESIYDSFVDELVHRTKQLRVGPPEDPRTQVGPLVHPRHRQAVAAYVELAREEGGRVRCGGAAPEGDRYAGGAYYLPTVIDRLPGDARTCQEEIFGPVLVCLPYKGEEDLIAQANDSIYGLACGIWTRDARAAWRLARGLEAGTVWINTYKQFNPSTPFGGFKQSGLGRENGRDWIRVYQRQKSVYWGTDENPLPWAAGT